VARAPSPTVDVGASVPALVRLQKGRHFGPPLRDMKDSNSSPSCHSGSRLPVFTEALCAEALSEVEGNLLFFLWVAQRFSAAIKSFV
jgi:hypothetical protein